MFVEWKNVWINPETKHRLNINRLSQFNEVPRLTLSFLHCFPYFPPLLSICSACFVGTSFITSFSTFAKNVRIISFFLEQSNSLKCLLNFFYFLQRKWSHWNGLQWLGTFDTPFKKSVMGFFSKKTYFFEVETTNHYFFCSILSDNEPMCGFFKKKEMFENNTTRKKIFEKTNQELSRSIWW